MGGFNSTACGEPRVVTEPRVDEATAEAIRQSQAFHDRYLADVPHYADRHQLRAKTLSDAISAGRAGALVCEFGVGEGWAIRHFAQLIPNRTIYGFDSFEGLPEDWRPGFPKGKYSIDKLPDVPGNVELIVGLFDETLGPFLEAHPDEVAFIHIDCDLYGSTRIVFNKLAPRIRTGTVILFDEFYYYPGWAEHEHKAFEEFISSTGKKFEYIGCCTANWKTHHKDFEKVAVRIR